VWPQGEMLSEGEKKGRERQTRAKVEDGTSADCPVQWGMYTAAKRTYRKG
jgi:hypothetical protein